MDEYSQTFSSGVLTIVSLSKGTTLGPAWSEEG